MNKYKLYSDAFIRETKKQLAELEVCGEDFAQLDYRKPVFFGIRMMNETPESTDVEDLKNDFNLYSGIKNMVMYLTPNEFMTIFPVSKIYDGERYGMKDYFYTMNYINQMDRDKPIGEKALEFLMEYTNREIEQFNVLGAMLVSGLRRADGHLDLMEEFMASNGMETPNTFKNAKGDAMYVRNGRPTKIKTVSRLSLV